MYILLFFFSVIHFIPFFSNAMTFYFKQQKSDRFNLATMPNDIIQKIIFIEASDLHMLHAYIAQNSFLKKAVYTFNNNEYKTKDAGNFILNFITKDGNIEIFKNCLSMYRSLLLTNKALNISLKTYNKFLLDKNILFNGEEFQNAYRCIINDKTKKDAFDNPFLKLIDIEIPLNLRKTSETPPLSLGKYKICPSLDIIYDCTLRVTGSIRINDTMYCEKTYKAPIVRCDISINAPLNSYNLNNLNKYCSPNNQYCPIIQLMQPIFDNWNQRQTIDFNLIENLFDALIKIESRNKEQISLFLSLCKHAFNNFNKFNYENKERERVRIQGKKTGPLNAGITIFFDLGPKNEHTIPLALINNILKIDTDSQLKPE